MAHHGNRWKQASLLLLLSSHVGNMWSEFIPYILKFMLADIYYNNEFLIGQRGTVMLLRERRSPHSWNSLSALLGYACDATKASAEANKERSQTCRKDGRNKHNDRGKNPSPPFFLEFNKCIIYFPKCFLFMLPHHPILSHSGPIPIPVRWQPGAHQGMINHPVRVCSSSDLCFHINWGHSCLSLRAGETLGWGFSLNLLSENGPLAVRRDRGAQDTRSHAGGTLCCGRRRLLFVALCGDALVLAARSHVGPSPPGGFHRASGTLRRPPVQQAERHDEENAGRDDHHGGGEEDVEVLARPVNQSSCNSKIIVSVGLSAALLSPLKQLMRPERLRTGGHGSV